MSLFLIPLFPHPPFRVAVAGGSQFSGTNVVFIYRRRHVSLRSKRDGIF
jgi:hypothetical protein